MHTCSPQAIRLSTIPIVLSAVFLLSMVLTGCGGSTPTGPSSMGAPDLRAPTAGGVVNATKAAAAQTLALKIALASEIIDAATNPFLNKLPITIEAKADTTETAAVDAPPPIDPFQGLNLVGVVYKPKNAIALISFTGEIGDGTKLLKVGDPIMAGGVQLKVTKIDQNRVDIQEVGGGKSTRTLFLPELVGYQSLSGATGTPHVNDSEKGPGGLLGELTDTRRLQPGENNSQILRLEEPTSPNSKQ